MGRAQYTWGGGATVQNSRGVPKPFKPENFGFPKFDSKMVEALGKFVNRDLKKIFRAF